MSQKETYRLPRCCVNTMLHARRGIELTKADGQGDSPGAVTVARVVAWKTWAQDHSLHLFGGPATMSFNIASRERK